MLEDVPRHMKKCPVCKFLKVYSGPICPGCHTIFEVQSDGKIRRRKGNSMKTTTTKHKPAAGYVHRGTEVVQIGTRLPVDLKEEAEAAAEKLGTSLNRFIESSLRWYLETLKKEGSI